MDAYTDFASVYDLFMDNVPYDEWGERVISLMEKYDIKEVPEGDEALMQEAGLVVDLGCGTGTLTKILADKGIDTIGVDMSFEMLEVARNKCEFCEKTPMFLCQDMRELELFCTVGAVISMCDCINYLLTTDDLLTTFKLVNNYLYPRGLFIFDFNTVYKYRDVIGDTTIAENRIDGSFIWENFYYEEEQINEYDLTIYKKDDEDKYIRFEETHIQRGYEPETIIELVKNAGMEVVIAFDAQTEGDINEETQRVCIVAREIIK